MKQQHHSNSNSKKKKKKHRHQSPSRVSTNINSKPIDQQLDENKTVLALKEAFDSISFEEASSACLHADGDLNKAAAHLLANNFTHPQNPSTSSVSSDFTSSSSTSSTFTNTSSTSDEGFVLCNKKGSFNSPTYNNKHKRVVAITGTVSAVIGKDYTSRTDFSPKSKPKPKPPLLKEDAEQFLCSMLSDDSDLNMAVVRDVLCQCGYDVEKALDVLLDLSAPSYNHSTIDAHFNDKDDTPFLVHHNDNVTDGASNCTLDSVEGEVHESIWGYDCRDYSQVLMNSEPPSTIPRSGESDLPQKVLESLFNITRSSEHEPHTMNWRNVAKKLQSLGHAVNVCQSDITLPQQGSYAKGAEYHLFRQSAKQHWDSMRSYYQKAAVAYSKGERQYASYLSEQGKVQTKLAREADERASKDIFKARNKDLENVITFDLHGQHVKQAMRLLKLHLLFATCVRSVQTLRVITGCGSQGLGKSKLKQSITALLEKEGIRWSEENRGALLIQLDGFKEYSFLDSDSDTE